jgi:membrane protein
VASITHGITEHRAPPRHISRWGWRDIAVRTFKEVMDDRVMLFAGGVTYFLLLALFPAVTAFVSIYGLFTDPATVSQQLALLRGVIPPGGLSIIQDQLTRLTAQPAPSLSLALLVSLIIALWSASSGVKALFEAMNVAYDEKEQRNFLVLNAVALLFTLAGLVASAVMLAVVLAIPVVLGLLGLGAGLEWLVQIAGYVVMVLVLLTAIAALYRFGPSRPQAKWRWITPGAVLAVLVIGVVSALFSWYAASFGHFDKTYGSLGALIGFLFWTWVSVMAVLVGAELNSEIEHQATGVNAVAENARTSPLAAKANATSATGPMIDTDDGGRRDDWMRGYKAGIRQAHGPKPRLPLAYAIPAALAIGLLSRRVNHRAQ